MTHRFKITTKIYTIGFIHGAIAGLSSIYNGEYQFLLTMLMIILSVASAFLINAISKKTS